MATRTYKLPTVNAAGKMSFPDAVNGLATGVDFAMRGVQKSFGDPDDYKLPVATSSTLGGVRIGDGFKVFADGEIQPEKSEFVLKPATASALGGVAIGKNVNVDDAGKIIAGAGAFQSTNITESELAFGAVTGDKFRDGTILQEDIASDLYNSLLAPTQVYENAHIFKLVKQGDAGGQKIVVVKYGERCKLCFINSDHPNGPFYTNDAPDTGAETFKLLYENGAIIADNEFGTGFVVIPINWYTFANNKIEIVVTRQVIWNLKDNTIKMQTNRITSSRTSLKKVYMASILN